MSSRLVALLWIGLFLAQSSHAEWHLSSDAPPLHDCSEHGAGEIGGPDELEQEQHAECLFCEISSGFKTYFEPTQTEVSHQQGKVSSFEDQVPRPQFHGWAFVCLRGPPAAVFV